MVAAPVPVFDGHNDTLLKLELGAGTPRERSFFEHASRDHIDLPRARAGGFAGGLFAMYVPSRLGEGVNLRYDPQDPANFAEVQQPAALAFTLRMAARAFRLERDSGGDVTICRDADAIRAAMAAGSLAMVLHIEGAEAIDPDFIALDVLHAAGLRSLGPVWSRSNIFGHGAPMTCPASVASRSLDATTREMIPPSWRKSWTASRFWRVLPVPESMTPIRGRPSCGPADIR